MISDGAFSIFKRFSAREKPFHEMPLEENGDYLGAWEGFNLGTIFQMKNHSIGGDVQRTFKGSIPLHFDMLNATPYSLSKEGNLNVERMNGFKRFNAFKSSIDSKKFKDSENDQYVQEFKCSMPRK
jgi:hypothetical protein